MKKVLVVGAGGREHAIVRALSGRPQRPEVFASPGNAGIARDATIVRRGRAAGMDLVVVGPEAPLVAGLVDQCAAAGIPCFGPLAAAARLEGSKAFAKEVMAAAGVPTGGYAVVESVDDGLAAIDGYPAVIKADGLAAGKGVVIAGDEGEAREALEAMLVERRFGDAPVVVEEYLAGDELSLLAICDGETALPLAPARDYKRIGEGDTGPNTGGMGCFSPVPGSTTRSSSGSAPRSTSRSSTSSRAAGYPVPRRALRRPDADRRGRGCSSSTCASAIPRRRPSCRGCAPTCSTCSSAPGARRSGRCAARVVRALGGHRRARLARLPGVGVDGRRHRRARPRAGGRRGHPRRHRAATGTS